MERTRLAVVLLLIFRCTITLQTKKADLAPSKWRCVKPCPPGQRCHLVRRCFSAGFCYSRQVCVSATPHPPPAPPSCEDLRCSSINTCVLQEVVCIRPPCFPQPTCIPDPCATVRCGNTVCITVRRSDARPGCSDFPRCQFEPRCVPRVKPKPGFCPPPSQVSAASESRCSFDNNCPSTLLCCPGPAGTGRNCTAPAFPDPCENFTCPPAPDIVGGTCRLTPQGTPTCADRVCQPGSFFCRDGKQCFCSDQAVITCTEEPAPPNCPT